MHDHRFPLLRSTRRLSDLRTLTTYTSDTHHRVVREQRLRGYSEYEVVMNWNWTPLNSVLGCQGCVPECRSPQPCTDMTGLLTSGGIYTGSKSWISGIPRDRSSSSRYLARASTFSDIDINYSLRRTLDFDGTIVAVPPSWPSIVYGCTFTG